MKVLKAFRDPRLLIVMLQGFSSGLPLLLVGSTLKYWMRERGVDLATIGFFSLVSLPYTWKFIWSPLMDRFVPPLGRRRGWLLISQIGLVLTLIGISFVDPKTNIFWLGVAAVCVAFFSASQDIVIDAYRREVLPDAELGLGSSLYVLGYRVAMLVAGAGALIFAAQMSWEKVYWVMAAFMSVGILTSIFCPEPKMQAPPPQTLKASIVEPLREFFQRRGAWTILAFVLLYKVGEGMASSMYMPFFEDLHFTKYEIAAVGKLFGFWATIGGGIIGGALIIKLGQYRSLWLFGILQSIALALFAVLAKMGNDVTMLGIAVALECFTSGMATSAYMAFMASQSNRRFTATQYALFTSLMGIPAAIFGASTGILAQNLGWFAFYLICAIVTVPGLLILFRLRAFIVEADEEPVLI